MESKTKIKLAEDLNTKGMCKIENLLDAESIKKIHNIMNKKSFAKILSDSKFKYPTTLIQYLIKLVKLDFEIIKDSLFLKSFAKKFGLKEIADQAFQHKSELAGFDLYLSKKDVNEFYFDWHMDLSVGGKKYAEEKDFENSNNEKIKFFFFLTTVQIGNGSLGYIPYSQHIGKIVLDLIRSKKINYKPYQRLEDFKNLVVDKKNYNLIKNEPNGHHINKFLESAEIILSNKSTTNYEHEFHSPGGMFAFKELGMHRGAMPSKNDRYVLRFFYRRK